MVDDITGAWRLIDTKALDDTGQPLPAPYGPKPMGLVTFQPDGRMMTVLCDGRAELAPRVREHALAWAVAEVDAQRIDAWNIYQASRQAMTAALQQLAIPPDYLLIDAMQLDVLIEQKSLIKGDARSISIAAASILARSAP